MDISKLVYIWGMLKQLIKHIYGYALERAWLLSEHFNQRNSVSDQVAWLLRLFGVSYLIEKLINGNKK